MIEILVQSPNQFFKFDKDEEARLLLFEAGIVDKFGVNPAPGKATTQMAIFEEHPTHLIVGIRYLGHSKSSDNGYLVFCLPKTQYSWEQAMIFLKDTMAAHHGPLIIKSFSSEDN